MLQQRQQRGLGPTDTPTAEDQKSINLAGQNAGLRTQVQQTQAAYRELEQTGDRIFETFEKALTEPLREGETAAQRFGSVMVSVLTDIEKELLKLMVINPLKNALFGGEHRPEIGDVSGVLGGGKDGQGGGPLSALGKLFGFGGSRAAANDKGSAALASSTDKLVTSLGDQVSTIKDQVGSINSLVDTGQNQVGAIGNLVTSLGSGGGCGCGPGGGQGGGQGGGGGILGSLFGGSGMGSGGDGMASGGELSALSTEASANISAGAAGLHGGGLVGYDPPSFTRLVDPAMFANAPRFHTGLGADEFAAILQKGERVLTGQQQKQVHAAANSNNSGGGHNFTFNFPADASPDGFRRAGHQVATQVQSTLARAKARNTI
jgi:hypothetical protein